MLRVKVCGITNSDDAQAAVASGADALGFVFFKGSPRFVAPEMASDIIRKLPSFVLSVGVFVDETPDKIAQAVSVSGIDVIQLHGSEPPSACRLSRRVIKAIRVKNLDSLLPLEDYGRLVSGFLLDTYAPDEFGGTGRIFNWDIARDAKRFGKVILAGGLTPENVSDAVRYVRPYAVDVSSGVEREKGRKDHDKVRLFIERAKAA